MIAARLHRVVRVLLAAWLLVAACPPAIAGNRSDLWWNPAEAGRGLIVIDHETDLFVAWCTYTEDGFATWYVIPGGTLTADRRTFEGGLYSTRSADMEMIAFQTIREGSASIDFAPPDLPQGWARFSIRFGSGAAAIVETHDVMRQPFGTDLPAWGFDATDIWWNPSESGWGIAVIQHGSEVFAVMLGYTYGGSPTFYAIPSRRVEDDPYFEDAFAGSVYSVRTSSRPGAFDPASVRAEKLASASMSFPRAAGGGIGTEMEFYGWDDRFHSTLVRLPFGAGK